jgi:DNA-binding transcriptional MerR regulator
MTDRRLSIGALARASGLSVSALRFYDTAGVLRPARVDPATGYRWYDAEQVGPARLVAALRRVAVPLDDICAVLADRAAAPGLLDAHLRRLEDGLADARRQLRIAHDLVAGVTAVARCTVRGDAFATALAAVRFAVGSDPGLPALCGVLFDFDGTVLRLVASDRHRMAVATVPTRWPSGAPVRAIAPVTFVDGLPGGDLDVDVTLEADALTVDAVRTSAVDAVFPDYERFIRTTPARRITVTTAGLRSLVAGGPTLTVRRSEVSVLLVTGNRIDVLDEDHPDAVAFNREFLLEALDASGSPQLELALDGPIRPLVVTAPTAMNLLMPVNLRAAA